MSISKNNIIYASDVLKRGVTKISNSFSVPTGGTSFTISNYQEDDVLNISANGITLTEGVDYSVSTSGVVTLATAVSQDVIFNVDTWRFFNVDFFKGNLDTIDITFNNQTSEQVAALHNGIYRGYDLVQEFGSIEAIHNAVSSGNFSNIYIGDYIDTTITTEYKANEQVRLLVAGINVRLHKGSSALEAPHLALVPEDCFATTAQMNSSNVTTGGYNGCAMRNDVLPKYATALNSALGNHLLDFQCLWSNTVNTSATSGAYSSWSGASSNWEWYITKITLLSEVEVYGTRVLSSSLYDVGEANNQLPLFKLRQDKMVAFLGKGSIYRCDWWLCAVVDSTSFARVSDYGIAVNGYASNLHGVRPLVLFG